MPAMGKPQSAPALVDSKLGQKADSSSLFASGHNGK